MKTVLATLLLLIAAPFTAAADAGRDGSDTAPIGTAQPPSAQPAPPVDPGPGESESLDEYLDRAVGSPPPSGLLLTNPRGEARSTITGTAEFSSLATPLASGELEAKSSGAAGASNFANRVNDSLKSFLPLFQGMLDAVSTSDDGKAITLVFNPVRGQTFGELGFAVTAFEPQPSEQLLALLPADARPGQREALAEKLRDFDDLTYSASYNAARRVEKRHLASGRSRFFGRNLRLYEELLASYYGELLSNSASCVVAGTTAAKEALWGDKLAEQFGEGAATGPRTGSELRRALGSEAPSFFAARLRERRCAEVPEEPIREFATLFGQLAANQPQIVLTATRRERDPLVGPNSTTLNLSVEMPAAANLNELLRAWRDSGNWKGAVTTLEAKRPEIEAGPQWTVSATYTNHDRYHVSYLPTISEAAELHIARPGSHQLTGKLQYSRRATWQPMSLEGRTVFPSLHLSAEYIDVSDDPARQSRWLATLTYEMPSVGGTALPLSIVYASRGEFATEPDYRLSAHFGIGLSAGVEKN